MAPPHGPTTRGVALALALALIASVGLGGPASGAGEPDPTAPAPLPTVEEPGPDTGNTPDTLPRPAPDPRSGTGRATPTTPLFGLHIDDPQLYAAQRTCSPTAKPGALDLRNLLLAAYPTTSSLGISRDCGVGTTSEHKEGRALDWGVDVRTQKAIADQALGWLLATDAHGNAFALARRLGVMYMIWNRQIWRSWLPYQGWQPYAGPNPHTDHVHFSLSWAGPQRTTSWWAPHGTLGPIVPPPVGTPADFDGDGVDDRYLYAPGAAADAIVWGEASDPFGGEPGPTSINGEYTPVSGDFDGDGSDDVLWYAPGTRADPLHAGTPDQRTFRRDLVADIDGTYHPFVGDFDADGADDTFLYGPGRLPDAIRWGSRGSLEATTTAVSVNGVYEPYPGDFDGDGATDILWYGRGPLLDSRWLGRRGQRTFTSTSGKVDGYYRPFVGDFDANGAADVVFYVPGPGGDRIRWGARGRLVDETRETTVDGTYVPLVGDGNGDGATDIVWYSPAAAVHPRWAGRAGAQRFTNATAAVPAGAFRMF